MEWVETEDRIYKVNSQGEVVFVLPRHEVLKRVRVKERVGAYVFYRGQGRLLFLDGTLREYQRALGVPLSKSIYRNIKEYIHSVIDSVPEEVWYEDTGWEDGVFKHPLLIPERFYADVEDIYVEELLEQSKRALEDEEHRKRNEVFLEFLKSQCEEGTLFASLYTMGLSSLFIGLLEEAKPWIVIVAGKSGTGKTASCLLVQNAFLPPSLLMTAHATSKALRIILDTFKNIPLLFDNMFMFGGDMVKFLRSVDKHSVVFLTDEVLPERQFKDVLGITLADKKTAFGFNIDDLEDNLIDAWGHGLVFVQALNKNPELVKELRQKAFEWLKDKNMEVLSFISASYLLEEVLQVSLERTRQKIYILLKR